MKQQADRDIITTEKEIFYLKSWAGLYGLTLLTFLPFIFNFMWGNHDWQWVKEYTPLTSGFFEGRFSQFIFQNFLYEGKILPILTLLTALFFLTAGCIILTRIWELPTNKIYNILLGLSLVCAPYTLSWLYFAFITLSCLTWVFIVLCGIQLLRTYPQSTFPKIYYTGSIILFTLALGGYPPVINLICVITFSLILNDLCLKKLTPQSIFKKYLPYFLSILIAGILVLIIQSILKQFHLQYDTYNTAELTLKDIFPKIIYTLTIGIKQFFTTSIFFEYSYKYMNLCLFLMSVIVLYRQMPQTYLYITTFVLALTGLIFSSVLTTFLASNTQYVLNSTRIEFFGLIYLYTYAAAILLKTPSKLIRNFTCAILVCILFHNFNTVSYAQKIWSLGFNSETKFAERIIKTIEENPNFNPQKKYTFVQSGTLDFRSRFANADENKSIDDYMLKAPYIPWHLPSKAYQFYAPKNFVTADFDVYWSFVDPNQIHLTNELSEYLYSKSQVWPQPNAIFINPETIILTLTQDGKNRAYNWIRQIP